VTDWLPIKELWQ